MTLDMVQYFYRNMIPFIDYLIPSIDQSFEQDFIAWRKLLNFNLGDIHDAMSHSFDDMIPSGPRWNQSFSVTYTVDYGKCMRIDFNKNSTRIGNAERYNPFNCCAISGSKGGDRLIFDVQGWDYLPLIANNYIHEGIVFQVTYGNVSLY